MLVLILLAQVGKKMQAIEIGGPESGGLQDDEEEEDLADGSEGAALAARRRGGKEPVASSSQQGGRAAAMEGGPMKRPKHGGTAAVVATAADDEMTAGRWGEPGSLPFNDVTIGASDLIMLKQAAKFSISLILFLLLVLNTTYAGCDDGDAGDDFLTIKKRDVFAQLDGEEEEAPGDPVYHVGAAAGPPTKKKKLKIKSGKVRGGVA